MKHLATLLLTLLLMGCSDIVERSESTIKLLSTVEHRGIVEYRPDELVVTVRSGTPLGELRRVLAREGQMLPFEPPEFRGLGTVGGAVASGLAGPARPWRGGVRDSILGLVLVNGLAQRLTFGGQVMKNVAGFDVSRIQAGAFGIFGVLLEVSFKVLPQPVTNQSRVLEVSADRALELMREWAQRPLPISATAFEAERLYIRLSGAESAVLESGGQLGGELLTDTDYWAELRDHRLPFFRTGRLGFRKVPPASQIAATDGLIEWSGARRWCSFGPGAVPEKVVPFSHLYAGFVCGQAGGDPLLAGYQRGLKAAFDPDNLFNPEICDANVTA